jgi:hypothetical protein
MVADSGTQGTLSIPQSRRTETSSWSRPYHGCLLGGLGVLGGSLFQRRTGRTTLALVEHCH